MTDIIRNELNYNYDGCELLCRPRETTENDSELSDHEEEFYYTEVELGLHTSSPPTLSHRDMARPPHEGRQRCHFGCKFVVKYT